MVETWEEEIRKIDAGRKWDKVYLILSAIFLAIAIIAAILEILGIIKELGIVITIIGAAISLWITLMSSIQILVRVDRKTVIICSEMNKRFDVLSDTMNKHFDEVIIVLKEIRDALKK
ncbi:MAG: hypothetical protein HY929_08290 [Euryarchaeota archaeon]|nr:hypothetical protein [Euryarchaeota archaeon]